MVNLSGGATVADAHQGNVGELSFTLKAPTKGTLSYSDDYAPQGIATLFRKQTGKSIPVVSVKSKMKSNVDLLQGSYTMPVYSVSAFFPAKQSVSLPDPAGSVITAASLRGFVGNYLYGTSQISLQFNVVKSALVSFSAYPINHDTLPIITLLDASNHLVVPPASGAEGIASLRLPAGDYRIVATPDAAAGATPGGTVIIKMAIR